MPFLPRSLMALAPLTVPPACHIGDESATGVPEGDGRFTMLDTVFRLPAVLHPNDFVPACEIGLLLCSVLGRLHDAK